MKLKPALAALFLLLCAACTATGPEAAVSPSPLPAVVPTQSVKVPPVILPTAAPTSGAVPTTSPGQSAGPYTDAEITALIAQSGGQVDSIRGDGLTAVRYRYSPCDPMAVIALFDRMSGALVPLELTTPSGDFAVNADSDNRRILIRHAGDQTEDPRQEWPVVHTWWLSDDPLVPPRMEVTPYLMPIEQDFTIGVCSQNVLEGISISTGGILFLVWNQNPSGVLPIIPSIHTQFDGDICTVTFLGCRRGDALERTEDEAGIAARILSVEEQGDDTIVRINCSDYFRSGAEKARWYMSIGDDSDDQHIRTSIHLGFSQDSQAESDGYPEDW